MNIPKAIRTTLAETFKAFGFKQPKNLGKYLPAEKVFSYTPWAIIVTVIIVTGLIKSFRYLYPIPPTFIAQVTTLHGVGKRFDRARASDTAHATTNNPG
ncbi:MAG: hypothetical protein HZC40_25400 [Chloroflexi bacterium]|nr:hypothetical protein [Chloroflexota bacterium]